MTSRRRGRSRGPWSSGLRLRSQLPCSLDVVARTLVTTAIGSPSVAGTLLGCRSDLNRYPPAGTSGPVSEVRRPFHVSGAGQAGRQDRDDTRQGHEPSSRIRIAHRSRPGPVPGTVGARRRSRDQGVGERVRSGHPQPRQGAERDEEAGEDADQEEEHGSDPGADQPGRHQVAPNSVGRLHIGRGQVARTNSKPRASSRPTSVPRRAPTPGGAPRDHRQHRGFPQRPPPRSAGRTGPRRSASV